MFHKKTPARLTCVFADFGEQERLLELPSQFNCIVKDQETHRDHTANLHSYLFSV